MGGSYAKLLTEGIVVVGFVAMVVAIGTAWKHKASIGWMAANVAVWVVVAGIFITVYVYQTESTPAPDSQPSTDVQAAATTGPPAPVEPDSSSLRIFADSDGHYRVDGLVNGVTVQFLIDAGASVVLLSPDDARHAGIDPDTLQYGRPINTPNGLVPGADIVIYQLAIGPIRLVNVAGAVVRTYTKDSLLGISFLSRLSGYEVSDGAMTLHQ